MRLPEILPTVGAEWGYVPMGFVPHGFQSAAWEGVLNGQCGLLNAPTGSGKTYALLLPFLRLCGAGQGLQLIWVAPIRALTKEIKQAADRAILALNLNLRVEVRTGDTSAADKQKQKRKMPEVLITTPESLHVLFAQKHNSALFGALKGVVVDEWHELLGSKRAVLVELALSRFRGLNKGLLVWGISATIGNLEEAMWVLLGSKREAGLLIRANIKKRVEVLPLLPKALDKLPWAGHLGLWLLPELLQEIEKAESCLVFTNTRGQAEIWYQRLLEAQPDLAGRMAMHHGSMGSDLRHWVEDALHDGHIKAVVCTSSLDLGVDFRPVDRVFQIGSPKGVARFLQRAGRSGHRPGAVSRIYFVPTHALELIESAALREAIEMEIIEARTPFKRSFDVLLQYLTTLAVGEGLNPQKVFNELLETYSYGDLSTEEWAWCLHFLVSGGALGAYDDFKKLVWNAETGSYTIFSRRMAMRHRMQIGVIVSDGSVKVRLKSGGYLGQVEEYFISKLNPGDVFWFAGQNLTLLHVREMTATVEPAKGKRGIVPSWMGGRMPLSAELGQMLRKKLLQAARSDTGLDPELNLLKPMLDLQQELSLIPDMDSFLIETLHSDEGHHVFFYPFEGRFVHEGMAGLLAWRLSVISPISFSIAMNDYGFELLSEEKLPIAYLKNKSLFDWRQLSQDVDQSLNATEMARRRFRDIASIAGLVFQGYPGQRIKERHLQSHSSLIFDVFAEHDPRHLLFVQAFNEARMFQLEEARLRLALERIENSEIRIVELQSASPLCFPILVDRLRQKLSSEQLEDRIARIIANPLSRDEPILEPAFRFRKRRS